MSIAKLPLGEKLRLIRKDRGLSLENIAHETGCSVATLSRLERGETEVDDITFAAIKATLGVENAPLLEDECEYFTGQIWLVNDMLAADRLEEVKTILQELSTVLTLPYPQEILLLYNLTDVRLIFDETGDLQLMQEKLDADSGYYGQMGDEARCLYHYGKASIDNMHNKFKEALKHYLTALEHKTDNLKTLVPNLLVNIGCCYGRLGKYLHAVLFFERANMNYSGDLTASLKSTIDVQLSVGYRAIGELKKARQHTAEALTHARRVKYDAAIGLSYTNYAEISIMAGDYNEALGYCEQSFEYLKDEKRGYDLYLNALYIKAKCLLELKRFAELGVLCAQGKELAKEYPRYVMLFESIIHLTTLKNSESEDFIENITIPELRKKGPHKPILYYCGKLEEHFRKKKSTKRAMAMVEITRDVYKSSIVGVDV